ncbi:MAG: Orotate phosphoribosyltransferase [Bacteroidia bacterium]|nr:Orotate phosphoribosyltransferase [Bacteroidia bacterium]
MLYNKETALKVAEQLLQIKAIKLSPDKPFTWASGWKSPIYCDNRLSLSYPEVRDYIRRELALAVIDKFGKPDVIAGVATGAIAWGALVAQDLGLPFVYVRSAAKGHGLSNMIEGYIERGLSVVVIEDLISTGMSSLKAVNALRDAGCKVNGMVSIFTYGFEEAERNFESETCKLISLSDYDSLIKQAVISQYINENSLKSLEAWRNDPVNWGV